MGSPSPSMNPHWGLQPLRDIPMGFPAISVVSVRSLSSPWSFKLLRRGVSIGSPSLSGSQCGVLKAFGGSLVSHKLLGYSP